MNRNSRFALAGLAAALAFSATPIQAQGVMDQLKEVEKKLEQRPEPPDSAALARQRCSNTMTPCRTQLIEQGYKVTHRGPLYRSYEGEHWLILMKRDDELALCVMVREGRSRDALELPCVPMKPDDTGD